MLKSFKRKYRIIEANSKFYPQFKKLWPAWEYFIIPSPRVTDPLWIKVEFKSLKEAQRYIDFVCEIDNPKIHKYNPCTQDT